ncbi:TobH protein [Mycolicibacterium komossense]|uniref:TobH protein n=1 Tax=Mycolicibacterium komossense TaxID=1779 RepID=A0ABT3CD16_9MYCO|nr:TobH protein [Mycolicibacterium komossense]MCV7227146.1 TobH protein [Mycolicibacterium komossense]
MSALRAGIDLDDTEGLIAADREGLLRAASMAGAQVRATATAVAEGALESLRSDQRPRSVIWVSGRGAAASAGAMLTAVLGGSAAEPIVVAAETPPWIGPLDVLVIAGDDPADPALVAAAATGVRRGSSVVIAAPHEGPLRDVTAGRAAVLAPRLWVPDDFGLCRYLAAGLATMQALDSRSAAAVDLMSLADQLDAEALRNSAGREVFTNAAKALADRMTGRSVVLTGDSAATLALARHGAAVLLRIAHKAVGAAGLADALVALRSDNSGDVDSVQALFHDEELDGPLPDRLRVLALTMAAERQVVVARVAGLGDVDVVGVEDVPDPISAPVDTGRPEQQLAMLAVRVEMAAVYLRLARG